MNVLRIASQHLEFAWGLRRDNYIYGLELWLRSLLSVLNPVPVLTEEVLGSMTADEVYFHHCAVENLVVIGSDCERMYHLTPRARRVLSHQELTQGSHLGFSFGSFLGLLLASVRLEDVGEAHVRPGRMVVRTPPLGAIVKTLAGQMISSRCVSADEVPSSMA
jgi:hypothetical protein